MRRYRFSPLYRLSSFESWLVKPSVCIFVNSSLCMGSSVIDFLPGVIPYESTIVAEFFPSGETVRMVVTLDPMHDEEFTKMQTAGFTSQLSNLDKRYGGEKR